MRFHNLLTILIFGVVILFFTLNQLFQFIPDAEYNENKKKADLPIFDITLLDPLPGEIEAYLTDNFSLRGYFLDIMGSININIWNKSPKPDRLIIGKDKWLFGVKRLLDYYLGKSYYSDKQMKTILDEFKYRKHILDSMGIQMAVVIYPSKYAVYDEYLPNYIKKNNSINASEKLINYFNENSDITALYPREPLLKHKNDHQLFYKGDTHWNCIGGYYAGKYIVDNLNVGVNFPEIPFNAFSVDTNFTFKGNLANMTGNAKQYVEAKCDLKLYINDASEFVRIAYPVPPKFPWAYQQSFKSVNENMPNVLIFRDSFGDAIIPYLKNSFYHSTFIFDSWCYGFNLDIIKQEKPDIVLFTGVETVFTQILEKGLSKK